MKREKRNWLVQTRVVKHVSTREKGIVVMPVDQSHLPTKCICGRSFLINAWKLTDVHAYFEE